MAERFLAGADARRAIAAEVIPLRPLAPAALRGLRKPMAVDGTTLPVVLERLRFRQVWPQAERMVVRATVLVPHRSALVQARAR